MSIFPLDSVRNARIDQGIELLLEEVRRSLQAFHFTPAAALFTGEEILEVFDASRPRLNVLAQILNDMTGRGADISAGFGFLSVLLARQGLEVCATETDTRLSEFAEANDVPIKPYRIGVGKPPFQPRSLDFIVLSEVIEHLKVSPLALFSQLVHLLKPGGMLVVTTPNVARLEHLEALAMGENFLEPFPEDVPIGDDPTKHLEHVREYSVRETVQAMEAAGLYVEQVLMTSWGDRGYDLLPNPYVNDIMVVSATK